MMSRPAYLLRFLFVSFVPARSLGVSTMGGASHWDMHGRSFVSCALWLFRLEIHVPLTAFTNISDADGFDSLMA